MNVNNIGRVLVSLVVVVGFMVATYMFLTEKAAGGTPSETLTLLVGALASNFTSVVSYWIGSSSGSTAKDEQISKTAEKLAEKVPVVPADVSVAAAAAMAAAPAAAAVAAPQAAAEAAPPAVDAELERRGIPDNPKGA
jgi:3-phosphoglycerate kinase